MVLGVIFLILIIVCGAFFTVMFVQQRMEKGSIEKSVDHYYELYNTQNFESIYNDLGNEELRSSVTFEEFEKIMTTFHQKLGNYKSRHEGIWRMNYTTGGRYFLIQYPSLFDSGEASDSFTLKKERDVWRLVGYHTNSKALLG